MAGEAGAARQRIKAGRDAGFHFGTGQLRLPPLLCSCHPVQQHDGSCRCGCIITSSLADSPEVLDLEIGLLGPHLEIAHAGTCLIMVGGSHMSLSLKGVQNAP